MRLRNIPGSRDAISRSPFVVHEPALWKGKWQELFGNDRPVQIEIGMGKGRFLMDMAKAHPEWNFVGIEMYSSVLVRAVQKAGERFPDFAVPIDRQAEDEENDPRISEAYKIGRKKRFGAEKSGEAEADSVKKQSAGMNAGGAYAKEAFPSDETEGAGTDPEVTEEQQEAQKKEAENSLRLQQAGCNFRFIRMDAQDLPFVFEKGELANIYLNFSDPWPKDRHKDRRLTSGKFLGVYEQVLSPGGRLEFKTDNRDLFVFSLEELKARGWKTSAFTFDLHHNEEMNKGNIMTEYEEKFSSKGQKICKLVAAPQ